MESKVIVFIACLAVASAGLLPEKSYLEKLEENDPHPNYEFSYNVADLETGDVKSQRENRNGDNVQGQYSLNDADGYKRIVDYSVNGESGFNAVVRREPLQAIVTVPKVVPTTAKPLVAPQPIVKSVVQTSPLVRTTVVHHHQPTVYHAAPAVHLAPTAHVVHSARATTLVKSTPTVITTHHSPAVIHHSPAAAAAVIHHSPAVVHHAPTLVHHAPSAAVVHHHTPSIASPHHQVSYVHYH